MTNPTNRFPTDWVFPPLSHPSHALFDLHAFRGRLEREDWRDIVTIGLRRAKAAAAEFFAANPKAKAFVLPVWMADDSVRLVRIGPRGGHRVLWTFRRASW